MLTGYLTTLPTDTLLSAGVLYCTRAGAHTPIGVTEGAPDFDEGSELGEIMFDNRAPSRLKGLSRVIGFTPVIKGTLKELGSAASGRQIALLEPGETEATVSNVTTVTPRPTGSFFAVGEYIVDFRWTFERAGGGFACIYAPLAIVRKWAAKGVDKKEAQFAFEIEAIGDPVNDLSTAPYAFEIRTALPTGTPSTPELLVAAVNGAGTAQITHAWAPGRGHTTTLGRKTDIADFIGGGVDGVLHLVPSFVGANGSGIKYDPATPDRFTFDTSSMKVVAANDLDVSTVRSRSFGFIGLRNNDTSYFMQSHDGTGAHAWSWDFDGATFCIAPLPGGSPSSAKTTGIPTDGHVQHCILQYDAVGDGTNAEVQGVVGRDGRCWGGMGQAGSTVGLTGTRTLEIGNFFGGSGGNNLTGDFRFMYIVAGGTLNRAQLKILNDYAEQFAGAYVDTRNYLAFSGNSLVAVGVGQWALQTRALLGSSWIVLDLGVPGYTWTNLANRAPRVEALLDFTNRTKPICAFHEYTNTVNFTTTPTAAAFASASMAAEAAVFGATTGRTRKKLLVTMLPTTENYAFNSTNGLNFDANVRIPGNALLKANAYWDGICDAGGDAIMGLYAKLDHTLVPQYYTDEVHPNTTNGTPIIANLLKTAALAI